MALFSSILRQATPTVVGRARGRVPSDCARKLNVVQTTTRAVVTRVISRGNAPAHGATKVAARGNVPVGKDVRVPARVTVDVARPPKEVVRPARVTVPVNVARIPKKVVQPARVNVPVDVARAPKEVVRPENVARAPKKVVQPARVNVAVDVAGAPKEVVRPLRVNVPVNVARAPKEVVRPGTVNAPLDVAPFVRPVRVNVPLDRKDVVGPARGKMPVRKEAMRPARVNVPKNVVRVPADVTSVRPERVNVAADVSRKGVLRPARGNVPAHGAHKGTVRQARGNVPAHGANKGVMQEKGVRQCKERVFPAPIYCGKGCKEKPILRKNEVQAKTRKPTTPKPFHFKTQESAIWKSRLHPNQLKDCSKMGRGESDAPIQDNFAPNNDIKCPLLVQARSKSESAENTRSDNKSRKEAEPKPRSQAHAASGAVAAADEYGDPQMCEAYSSDIYEYVHSLEKEYQRRPLPDYIGAVQTDITANMRAQVVAWLVDVSEEFKLVPDTLFLSVSYFDRFLSLQPLGLQQLQLLGATCMFVASKYEEISRLHVDAFCYTKKEVLKMEESILHILKFELGDVTINTFLRRLIRFAPACPNPPTLQFEYLCNFLSELSLIDYDCVKFVPSQIAASVVFVAKFTLNPEAHPWNLPMQNYSGYKPSDLKACVLAIHDLQHDRKWEPISKAAKTKYSQQSYQFASTLLSPVVIPSKYFEDPK